MISQEEFAERFLKKKKEEFDLEAVANDFELALERANELLEATIIEKSGEFVAGVAARDKASLLDVEEAKKEAAELRIALAAAQSERDAMRAMHDQSMAKIQAEIMQERAARMAETEMRASLEARLSAVEESLSVERSKPLPKPEQVQVLVPVEKMVERHIPDFRMKFTRDKNGRIVGDVLFQPLKDTDGTH